MAKGELRFNTAEARQMRLATEGAVQQVEVSWTSRRQRADTVAGRFVR